MISQNHLVLQLQLIWRPLKIIIHLYTIVLFDEIDKVADSVDKDTLLSIGYFSKDAKSESYGISLKSIYNNYWESTAYFSSSSYNFGLTDIDDSKIQNLHHLQLRFFKDLPTMELA